MPSVSVGVMLQTNEVKMGTGPVTQKTAAYVHRCGFIGLGTVPKLCICNQFNQHTNFQQLQK